MPFNTEQFLDVFARYNEGVFPLQILLVIAALVMIRLAQNGDTASSKIVATMLGLLWLWMGVIYHLVFFSEINTLAFVFGAAFILQAAILFYAGVVRRDLSFRQQFGIRSLIGTFFIVYALLIYPVIGMAAGHTYPYAPTFGLPCPTTIFMFGLFLRSGRSVPLYVLPIPIAWSLLGFSAAFSLGIREDVGLLIAGLIGGLLLVRLNIRRSYALPRLSLKEK